MRESEVLSCSMSLSVRLFSNRRFSLLNLCSILSVAFSIKSVELEVQLEASSISGVEPLMTKQHEERMK